MGWMKDISLRITEVCKGDADREQTLLAEFQSFLDEKIPWEQLSPILKDIIGGK